MRLVFLCFLALCWSCTESKPKLVEETGDDLVALSTTAPLGCNQMTIQGLPHHVEQSDFDDNAPEPLQLGLAFVPGDELTDEIIKGRFFRLQTSTGLEVLNVDARATGYWPNGTIKWLWLRFNDRHKRTDQDYAFYWGNSPACKAPGFGGGSTAWRLGDHVYFDSKPTSDCRPDGEGCTQSGTGVEAVLDLTGDKIIDSLSVDGVPVVTQGIKPVLEGQKRLDGESLDYRTKVLWHMDKTTLRAGRAGTEVGLHGFVLDEDTGERIAALEVTLDLRRNFSSIGLEHSITWLMEGEDTDAFAWDHEDSSVELPIICDLDVVKERKHSHTIGRLGLLIRSAPGSFDEVSFGDCLGTGAERNCTLEDRLHTREVTTGPPLIIRQEGPLMYTVNDEAPVNAHLAGGMTATGPDASIEVAVQHFWQTYPSAFEIRDNGISIDLYPDWAPDWTFSFHEEDGTPEAPLVYKPLPGHNVPGETKCIREEAGLSVMDFYMHFLHGNLISEPQSTGCLADHMKRGKVLAHGASRTHRLELAFYTAERAVPGRGAKRASLLNHPSILRQDPESALRINFLGLQMVPVQDLPRFKVLEEALEGVLHLNSTRFRCRHDFGFWHFGKAQGHYGLERLDRWSDGIQYGHQAIPWLLYLRGGDRATYEEAMIQSRHAFDVAINKHYLDPDWIGRSVSESDFSASPFNWGKETLGLQSNLNFLAFYHHLGGQDRVQRLLQEYAMDMNETDAGDGLPVGTHKLSNRARANFVPNALWALLVEEVGDDRDLIEPDLPLILSAFEARWLERTFSIGDVIGDDPTDGWGPNYIPQSSDTGHERFDPEAAGIVSPFAQPRKGLERGFLIQWARGNILESYWPYIFDHTNESGFVPESWRGLTRMEAIQLGPMLSSHTEDPLHARRSWTHADRIARVMPDWDGLISDTAEPLGDGETPPIQTQWFDEDSLRDLSHALLAGITARVQWDSEGNWSDDYFSDTVFELKNGCAHAWIQSSSLEGAEAASFMFIGDSNSDDAVFPWTITIQIWEKTLEGEVQRVLESPIVLSQPPFPASYIRENGDYVSSAHLFPESFAQQVTVDLPDDGEPLLISAYFLQEGSDHVNHKGFFQVVPMDTKSRVVHERPVGANLNAPIGFASQGLTNHTKYDDFTGASVLVKLNEAGIDGLHLFDINPDSTEPFSYRDRDGEPVRMTQLTTFDAVEGNMKKTVQVVAPPEEWLELTNAGQGLAQLGINGYDTYVDETYTQRSPYVLPTQNIELWFEPSDSGWRGGGILPGCLE